MENSQADEAAPRRPGHFMRFAYSIKRAGEGTRTLDIHDGNVVLCQLSYTRNGLPWGHYVASGGIVKGDEPASGTRCRNDRGLCIETAF